MLQGKNRLLFLIAGAAIAAMLAVGAGSAAAYDRMFPAVWTERLPFMNSTGQFDTVTACRNATDDTYANVTRFVTGARDGLGADMAADPQYRCVEYAVRLHDEAERHGLDCAVIRTGTGWQTPAHALVIFQTTDRGMLYVDPTAMNVSAGEYPGIDFSKVLLLRTGWNAALPYVDAAGIRPAVTEHRNAGPVPFHELEAFLASDDTEARPYMMPDYTCLDFAAELHNRAEAAGIRCGIVTVAFSDRAEGHAFNAFPTTDRGIVYVDCTGINGTADHDGAGESTGKAGAYAADRTAPTDNIVYLRNDSELGELPVAQVNGSLDYAFYLDRKTRIDAYREQWDRYTADVVAYNANVSGHDARLADNDRAYAAYRSESDRYAAALAEYNRQMDLHNSAVRVFNDGDTTVSIPDAPVNAAELEAWQARLDNDYDRYLSGWNQLQSWRQELGNEKATLDSRMATLKTAEESRWITCSPLGTVEDVQVYWG